MPYMTQAFHLVGYYLQNLVYTGIFHVMKTTTKTDHVTKTVHTSFPKLKTMTLTSRFNGLILINE